MEKLKEKNLKALLNFLQKEFPLVSEPFKILAEKFGLEENEIIDFLKDLKKRGIIRHFGATVDSYKLGYITCLCATSIPEEKIESAYEIAKLPEITHAYLREHELNFWFTIITKSEKDLEDFCKKLEEKFQIKIKLFPAIKKFKVKAVFEI
ncbi:MAG: Lrp/AsnC family transcriptional regulator [Thermodesulfobacterium geofontis]|uniref:siroheme decarboxylase n=1 Tax=Thermodesulfobacterium geofontis TaxID=1295609 RepID=A0A2N7QDC4_9BACT|nr:MAG: Lrp/AsnC family transcriptional regulator [Thermodesulfobacterium geofontis]